MNTINNNFHFTIDLLKTNNLPLVNKGFAILENQFWSYGWKLIKNDFEHIIYTKKENETDYFEIQVTPSKIYVSTPLRNSVYQYKTSFNNYFEVIDYIENKLYDYEN
jgi:hypothetical protein